MWFVIFSFLNVTYNQSSMPDLLELSDRLTGNMVPIKSFLGYPCSETAVEVRSANAVFLARFFNFPMKDYYLYCINAWTMISVPHGRF